MNTFDRLMIKYRQLYRVADTWIYVKYPPQDDYINEELRGKLCLVFEVSLMDDYDWDRERLEQVQDDKSFWKTYEFCVNISNRTYCRVDQLQDILVDTIYRTTTPQQYKSGERELWRQTVNHIAGKEVYTKIEPK